MQVEESITGQGKSSLTTAYGEVMPSQYHLAPEVKALMVTVPVQKVWTFYRAWGDVFAWLCLGTLLGVVVAGRLLRSSRFSATLTFSL